MYAVTDIGYEDDGSVGSISTRVQGIRFIAEYSHDDFWRTTGIVMSIGAYDSDEPRTITQSYTYLNYEDGDYYETPLIHSVTTTRPDGSETLYYTYDERGNITSIRRGVNDIVCRYTYDDLGQLIREDNRAHGATYTWTYDNAGNILSSKTYAYTTGSLGSAQRTVSYNYSSGSWGDLLTSNNGRSVTYDNIGNPLRWNDYGELTWQGRRLMRYYESEMECESLYTYNADGIRTSKTVNGVKHTYHLSGTQILSEEWTDRWNRHVMVYIYDAAGQPIGMSHFQDGTLVDTYLYEKNIQGDVVAVYDYAGDLVVRYAYNAWGAVSETEYGSEYCEESFEVLCNPFRYRGYYYDTETDLYYLNSRYYDPAVGRFLNADSYINANGDLIGFNMFAYCGNNPVNMVDDEGEAAVAVAGGYAGYIAFASTAGASNFWNPLGVILLTSVFVVGITFVGIKVYNKRKAQRDASTVAALQLMEYASTAATPPPPNKGGKGTQTNSKTLYQKGGKNGFRIDVENPGNRMGQIHLQQGTEKYYYNIVDKTFRVGSSNGRLAPRAIQELLNNSDVIKAIGKGLQYLWY